MTPQSLISCSGLPAGTNMSQPERDNCSFDSVDKLTRTLQLAVHIPTFLLGLVLNLLAIRGFSAFLKKRKLDYIATSIYMINLAVFDLLLVLSLPFKMVLPQVESPLPSFCTLVECLYFISMYGSVFTICFISLDRFLAIQYPILASHLRSPRKTFGICCIIWMLVWIGSIPIYTFHREVERYKCFHNMSDVTWSASVFFPLEIFGFLLPMGIMGFCSYRSIHILLRRPDSTEDWVQQRDTKGWVQKRACIWTIATNLVIFVVSFLPVHLGFFLQYLVRNRFILDCRMKQGISLFLQLSLCFSNINCCLDVFCYYFVIKEFRMRIKAHRPSTIKLVNQDTMVSRG
ncbi:G-protein coupled receptor 55 isoform X2 [Mus musculus]|uniref:G-protein coupled receptor 55 isoform X2 n=1 Tax=Mus musculus TaxID=10090 RepID=UPI0003D7149F|nr:G-protein coupled receptor 55 isoform X2 [Mus musculus]XP_030109572.1 G-protein coupled receptor 55 isoform X2 [Mus musculus]|eukprot:XP_006529522.1 PREDICTED: G-protein coupled receptor 55 isoform X2 [Mus musculus]